MANFRDIWNLIIRADSEGAKSALGSMATKVEKTGDAVENTFRGRMQESLGNFANKIPGVSGLMESFGVTSSQAGALMGTAVAGGALVAGKAVTDFVEKSIGEFQTQSQEVLHFKDVSGLAADEASRFVATADDFGVSGEDLATAIGKMDKAAGTTQHLQELGIQIGHNKDGAYDATQTFLNVVDAFNNTDDASRKAAIGSEVFGKGWQSVVKLIEAGSGEIKHSFNDVKDFQLFSDADLLQSEDYRHKMDDLNDAIKGFEREVGQAAIPVVLEFTEQLRTMAETADDALGPFGGLNLLMQTAATVVFPAYESSGGNVADVSRAMVEEAKKNVDQMEAIALATPKATGMVDDFRTSLDLTVGSGRDYVESNSAYRQSLIDTREALEKATKATQDFRQAQKDLRNDQLDLQGSIYSSMDAIDTYRTKTEDGTSSIRDQEKANIDVQKSFDDVAHKAIDAATKQAELHGATLTANGAIDAQRDALREVAKELGPEDGKVRAELDLYMLALSNIPGEIHTNVDLTGGEWLIGRGREGNTGITGSAAAGAAIVSNVKAYEQSNGTSWRGTS